MTMNCTFLLLATAKAALLRLPFVTYVFTAPATGARAFAYIQYIFVERPRLKLNSEGIGT